jgi:hypothetical protein
MFKFLLHLIGLHITCPKISFTPLSRCIFGLITISCTPGWFTENAFVNTKFPLFWRRKARYRRFEMNISCRRSNPFPEFLPKDIPGTSHYIPIISAIRGRHHNPNLGVIQINPVFPNWALFPRRSDWVERFLTIVDFLISAQNSHSQTTDSFNRWGQGGKGHPWIVIRPSCGGTGQTWGSSPVASFCACHKTMFRPTTTPTTTTKKKKKKGASCQPPPLHCHTTRSQNPPSLLFKVHSLSDIPFFATRCPSWIFPFLPPIQFCLLRFYLSLFAPSWKLRNENNCWKADDSQKSFLFTLKNPHNIPTRRFALMPKRKHQTIYCDSTRGLCFTGVKWESRPMAFEKQLLEGEWQSEEFPFHAEESAQHPGEAICVEGRKESTSDRL